MRRKTKLLLGAAVVLLSLAGGLGPPRRARAIPFSPGRPTTSTPAKEAPPDATVTKTAQPEASKDENDTLPNGGCPTMD